MHSGRVNPRAHPLLPTVAISQGAGLMPDSLFIPDFLVFFLKIIIYLFLAALGHGCCLWAARCGEQGLLFIAVCGLLAAVASLAVEHRL